MACIGCGLAVNADGTGRVDIDTKGGLTCVGGAGGTSNTANTGLAIKKNTTKAGNSLELSSNGLWVPPAGRWEVYQDTQTGGTITGPNSGGSSVATGEATVTVSNTTEYDKVFLFQLSFAWRGVEGLTPGLTAVVEGKSGGGSWFGAAGSGQANGTWISPITSPLYKQVIAAGDDHTFRAKAQIYTGTVVNYSVLLTVFGGYEA